MMRSRAAGGADDDAARPAAAVDRREAGCMGVAQADGLVPLASVAAMRAADRTAASRLEMPGRVLMEHGGARVARVAAGLRADAPEDGGQGAPVTVLAGRGHNGGDGLVAARMLHLAGIETQVLLLGTRDQLDGDAGANLAAWLAIDGRLHELEDDGGRGLDRVLAGTSVIVDAILGTGIRGEVQGLYRRAIECIRRHQARARVLAVDIPSGIQADTGSVAGEAVAAHVTVTFALPKPGHFLYPGAHHCGRVLVEPISMSPAAWAEHDEGLRLVTAPAVAAVLPRRPADGHKGSFGRVALVAGSRGMSGAAVLAGQGALYGGAGLTTLFIPGSLNTAVAASLPEVMTVSLADEDGQLARAAAQGLLERLERSDVVACGPGLGEGAGAWAVVQQLISQWGQPLILDADALNLLAGRLELLGQRPGPTILTPHPGEAARLLGATVQAVQADRLAAVRRLQQETGAVVILKGATTLTAAPAGVWFNPTGNAGMATGGSGDLLTGLIAALLGQGLQPATAAWAGAYLHGAGGDRVARHVGPEAVTASAMAAALGPAAQTVRQLRWDARERAAAWLAAN